MKLNLTEQDIADLTASLACDRPAFYKDTFHFNRQSVGVVRFLRRNGLTVECDDDTGRITTRTEAECGMKR